MCKKTYAHDTITFIYDLCGRKHDMTICMYKYMQASLRERCASLPLLTELRSEALKDRHWRPLLRRLGIRMAYHELNLGLLWGSAILSNKKYIGEMVLAAQGEMALEEFLRQARLSDVV